jgi:hypothetical protein
MSEENKGFDVSRSFFETGSQYYIAGRYAVFAWLKPVGGNILHHAIEQLLKGALSETIPLDQMKKTFGRDLPTIWSAFKEQANDPMLAQFDQVISTLHVFEELRYMTSVEANSTSCTFYIRKADREADRKSSSSLGTTGLAERQYSLCLEEIDKLVGAIYLQVYLQALLPAAKEYLVKDNVVTAITEFVSDSSHGEC